MTYDMRVELDPLLHEGQYVKINCTGPYEGLYGWVRWLGYLSETHVFVAAVSDTCDHSRSWRLFRCCDLYVEARYNHGAA